jgi:curved DNA-binding protein CbpA
MRLLPQVLFLAILLAILLPRGASSAPPLPPCRPGAPPGAPSCYALLHLERSLDASARRVRKAYRAAALLVHPDKCANCDDATRLANQRRFVDLAFAYETLRDDASRFDYERGAGRWAPGKADANPTRDDTFDPSSTRGGAWARSRFDEARDPLLTTRGWAALAACALVVAAVRAVARACDRAARRFARDRAATTGARKGAARRRRERVESEARAREVATTTGTQRREHRRREMNEAAAAMASRVAAAARDLNAATGGGVDDDDDDAVPERLRTLARQGSLAAHQTMKLLARTRELWGSGSVGHRVSDTSVRHDVSDAANTDGMAATLTRTFLALASSPPPWDSLVVGDEALRTRLAAWGKEAARLGRDFVPSPFALGCTGWDDGTGDGVDDMRRLTRSLRAWERSSNQFATLVRELAAHARSCAATLRAADARDRARWSKVERATLKRAMTTHPKGTERRWDRIAEAFEGRRSVEEVKRYVAEMVVLARDRAGASAEGESSGARRA